MKRKYFPLLIGCVLVASGCAGAGVMIKSEQAAGVVDGKTTKTEVEQMFGKPTGTGFDEQKRPVYIYAGSQVRPTAIGLLSPIPLPGVASMKTKVSRLEITFDKNDVVVSHKFAEEMQETGAWR